MNLKRMLSEALIDGYKRAGQEVGYWGYRFLGSVRRNGGLATVKRMLKPRNRGQRAGLDRLLKANRPDLTMEAIILRPKFRPLLSAEELRIARDRLRDYKREAARRRSKRERLYPDELEAGRKYSEGARRQIRVNAYERDRRARLACLKHYGYRCAVCQLLFEERYGKLGKNFIHIHHLKPLQLANGAYQLDPVEDLRPVCPNCHAMLHKSKRVLGIEELRAILHRRRRP